MADVHAPEIRSYNMSRIRSKDTKPEMLVRRFIFSLGYRYRVNHKGLPGKPDIVFTAQKKAIFVHGCFWHGHEGCKLFSIPKTRTEWWQDKIDANRKRDTENLQKLLAMGWSLLTIFECELRKDRLQQTQGSIHLFLNN